MDLEQKSSIEVLYVYVEFKKSVKKWLLIVPHQGLGDHILCNGLYREYSKLYKRLFLLTRSNNYNDLKLMLKDLPNITLIWLPNRHLWRNTRAMCKLAQILSIETLLLGGYGKNFLEANIRFDENFYLQAKVDFDYRWSSFFVERNQIVENQLFEELNCNDGPYIFLHQDPARNFLINRDYLPKGINIIEPIGNRNLYSIFYYRKVLERASEIHVIESSFAAYVESLSLQIPLFAHRYARPEAKMDPRQEFTYKNSWTIYAK